MIWILKLSNNMHLAKDKNVSFNRSSIAENWINLLILKSMYYWDQFEITHNEMTEYKLKTTEYRRSLKPSLYKSLKIQNTYASST